MKKFLTYFVVAVSFIISFARAETYTYYESVPVYDQEPVYKEVVISHPRKECWVEEIPVDEFDGEELLGGIIGGITGGVIGSHFGRGKGRDFTTAAGAIIGTIIGSRIADDGTEYKKVRKCRIVDYDTHTDRKIVGYRNYFYYNGKRLVKFSKQRLDEVRVRVTIHY